jgi:hypothetical protein
MTTVPSASSTRRQVGRLRSIHSEHLRSARSCFFQSLQSIELTNASVGCPLSFRIVLHPLEGLSDFHAILYSRFVISSRLCLSFSVYSTYLLYSCCFLYFLSILHDYCGFLNPRYIREYETREVMH